MPEQKIIEFNLDHLDSFLQKNEIPKLKPRVKTFLGIAKQPHYENVWSNIYAFFFNVNEVHHFQDLFIVSLLQIINEKTNQVFPFDNNFEIQREFETHKKGRIDLLLANESSDIIIENKVYHKLNNDLNDYYTSFKNRNFIQGIVLSLKPISKIQHQKFINITHLEFLDKVMVNLYNYSNNDENKYKVFLKDFHQNIINMSKPIEIDILDFYYKNEKQISEIKKIRDEVVNHVKSQIENVQPFNNIKLGSKSNRYNEKRLRYFESKNVKNLKFTILFDTLLKKEKKLYVYIEIQGDLINKKNLINESLFNDEEKQRLKKDIQTKTNKSWLHIAEKDYNLSDTEIENLTNYISENVFDETFKSIFLKLESVLLQKNKS